MRMVLGDSNMDIYEGDNEAFEIKFNGRTVDDRSLGNLLILDLLNQIQRSDSINMLFVFGIKKVKKYLIE